MCTPWKTNDQVKMAPSIMKAIHESLNMPLVDAFGDVTTEVSELPPSSCHRARASRQREHKCEVWRSSEKEIGADGENLDRWRKDVAESQKSIIQYKPQNIVGCVEVGVMFTPRPENRGMDKLCEQFNELTEPKSETQFALLNRNLNEKDGIKLGCHIDGKGATMFHFHGGAKRRGDKGKHIHDLFHRGRCGPSRKYKEKEHACNSAKMTI